MNTTENERRVKNATIALKQYIKGDPYDRQANVVDLLTDLRHYCEINVIDYHYCERLSYDHYLEEKREVSL